MTEQQEWLNKVIAAGDQAAALNRDVVRAMTSEELRAFVVALRETWNAVKDNPTAAQATLSLPASDLGVVCRLAQEALIGHLLASGHEKAGSEN